MYVTKIKTNYGTKMLPVGKYHCCDIFARFSKGKSNGDNKGKASVCCPKKVIKA